MSKRLRSQSSERIVVVSAAMVSLCRLRRGRGASKVNAVPESTGKAVIGVDMYGLGSNFRQGDSYLGTTGAGPT